MNSHSTCLSAGELAGPTKVFLLACGSLQEDSIPAGFIYKRGFQIRMKKGIQARTHNTTVHVCVSANEQGTAVRKAVTLRVSLGVHVIADTSR